MKKFNCKKLSRVKFRRNIFCRMRMHYQQKVAMEDYRNIRIFYGTIISENGKSGNSASFDDIPDDYKEVHSKRRSMTPVVDPDKEDQDRNHVAEECEKIKEKDSNDQLT